MDSVLQQPAYTQKFDISVISFDTHLSGAMTIFFDALFNLATATTTHGRVMSFTDFMLTLRTHQIISTIANAVVKTHEWFWIIH